ncbi:MAG: hypothetical protein H6550_16065 [Chitinophagales bacterium]|nr:hypothetical protein [Chitinophagales bacterium]
MTEPKRTMRHDIFNLPVRTRSINGKQKGNANEREAAKSLGLWTGARFVRVPQSGGLRWEDNAKVTGDIVCDTKGFDFPFSVETKHLAAVPYTKELRANSKVYKIWKQATTDAVRSQRLPMAMIRYNGLGKFMHDGEKYQDYLVVLATDYGGSVPDLLVPQEFTGDGIVAYLLSDLVKRYPYDRFIYVVNKLQFLVNYIDTHQTK